MDIDLIKEIHNVPKLNLAVIGHIELVTFVGVKALAKPGEINHANKFTVLPAGGGGVAAVQMSKLTTNKVHFFTALGRDEEGLKSAKILEKFGLSLHIAWRDKPTRKGISFIDDDGERTITVIGERLQPNSEDDLEWSMLKDFDGIFITATDSITIKHCRKAKVITATPRVGLQALKKANVQLDSLLGSKLDKDEQIPLDEINPRPKTIIRTEGIKGGEVIPGGKYKAFNSRKPTIDSYGCGDCFAAGVTAGLAAGWEANKAVNLGARLGAMCAENFGPYI
ncbi:MULTISPECIES: PfkB family carbohydrate kinase [Prochlorococcus]|uniref:PfkB family carbohydrate kinase n=1 Tax=Prochlorococcus TaxID=1218 RepID=UPI00053385AA|nr:MULTISPECIES: PfkB family carbohydrate kinase [Prochlorococcus]KGG12203.1 Ribokinase [Prochlorococcus sp. MIT 0601]